MYEALTHSSIRSPERKCNERLEFLGDSVLGMVIADYLFTYFQDFDEGDLTMIRAVVVSRATLSQKAKELGLVDFLYLGRGVGREEKNIPPSLLANLFEAIVGAIYRDSDLLTARNFILGHLGPLIEDAIKDPHQMNYKSLLQNLAQKYLSTSPVYRLIHVDGPEHGKTFTVEVLVGDKKFGPGKGKNKKEAEEQAAQSAFKTLIQEIPSCSQGKTGVLHKSLEQSNYSKDNIDIPPLFRNSKSLLQHVTQCYFLPRPIYKLISKDGPVHDKVYSIEVVIGYRCFPPASGKNKKETERQAARNALEVLSLELSKSRKALPEYLPGIDGPPFSSLHVSHHSLNM